MKNEIDLLVIVGPTASGKTALAIKLAQKYNGEIICADSRTVYKYMDVGTAKPTAEEQKIVKHHLLDVIEPSQSFTVADFQRLANLTIEDIASRGKLPILVGGSGMYVDAVAYNYTFSTNTQQRDPANPRHASSESRGTKAVLRSCAVMVGLNIDRNILRQRVTDRTDVMLQSGLIEEVNDLLARFPSSKALDAPAYKAFARFLKGECDEAEAKQDFINKDMQLAKRQMTWFKRNPDIQWANSPAEAEALLTDLLANQITKGQTASRNANR